VRHIDLIGYALRSNQPTKIVRRDLSLELKSVLCWK